jgi:putative drug exporter of the RND superfamily
MTSVLYAVGRFCARHRYPVAFAWLAFVVAIVAAAVGLGARTTDNLTLEGTGSTSAQDLLDQKLSTRANGTNPVVLEAQTGKLTTGANARAVKATVNSLRKAPHVVSAISPLGSNGSDLLSKDQTIGYIPVALDLSTSDLDEDEANEVIDAEEPAREAGLNVATGGYLGQEVSKA